MENVHHLNHDDDASWMKHVGIDERVRVHRFSVESVGCDRRVYAWRIESVDLHLHHQVPIVIWIHVLVVVVVVWFEHVVVGGECGMMRWDEKWKSNNLSCCCVCVRRFFIAVQ